MKALALAALLLLGSASPASAESAWILWWAQGAGTPGSHLDWETQSAYTRMEDCKKS